MNRARPVRAGAGKNAKYDDREYVLLSFPDKKKHTMVPLSVVDTDPLDDNDCSIKVAGRRRGARVIARGPKDDVYLKSTRFAKDAGSEEINLDGICVSKDTDGDSHSDYSFSPMKKTDAKSLKSSNTAFTTRGNDLLNSGKPLQSILTRTTQPDREMIDVVNISRLDDGLMSIYGKKRNHSSSSVSSASSDDDVDDRIGVKITKKGGMRSNIDLSRSVKNHKRRPKKGKTNENGITPISEIAIEELSKKMNEYEKRFAMIESELATVKKKFTVMRRKGHYARIVDSSAAMAVTSTNDSNEALFAQIHDAFNVKVSEITAPKGRPAMIMRELFKKSGHIDDWRPMLEAHEQLLQDFISRVCNVPPDELDICWDGIRKSLRGMLSDMKTNKRKKQDESATMPSMSPIPKQNFSATTVGSTTSKINDSSTAHPYPL